MSKKKKKSLPDKRSSNKCSKTKRFSHPIDFYDLQSNVGPRKPVDYTLPKSNMIVVFCQRICNMVLGFLKFIRNVCINININININMIQNNHNCQQFLGDITDSSFINNNKKNNEDN